MPSTLEIVAMSLLGAVLIPQLHAFYKIYTGCLGFGQQRIYLLILVLFDMLFVIIVIPYRTYPNSVYLQSVYAIAAGLVALSLILIQTIILTKFLSIKKTIESHLISRVYTAGYVLFGILCVPCILAFFMEPPEWFYPIATILVSILLAFAVVVECATSCFLLGHLRTLNQETSMPAADVSEWQEARQMVIKMLYCNLIMVFVGVVLYVFPFILRSKLSPSVYYSLHTFSSIVMGLNPVINRIVLLNLRKMAMSKAESQKQPTSPSKPSQDKERLVIAIPKQNVIATTIVTPMSVRQNH